MNIIGLGNAGCAIADKFAQYPQYNIYKIDVGLKGNKKDGVFAVNKQQGPEEYEKNCPSFKNFLKNVTGEVYLFVAGSGNISSCSLRLLETIKDCEINVVYIRPNTEVLSGNKKLLENITFNVFQEYARSAVFKRLYIVDNAHVESIIGEIPIASYYDTINSFIVDTLHMINVYKHSEPVQSHIFVDDDITRISTIGIYDIEKSEEKMFFSLDNVRNKHYIYAINKETLESDGSLFRKITQQTNSVSQQKVDINFEIFSTNYDHNYGYLIANSHIIQGQ
tara:strand:- start:80 stop:916 length:837 start_codon:yes stop_codon:yes gene_type:complete